MQFRLKLVASVAASLLASGAAFSAVSYTPGTYDGEAIGRNESAGLSDAPINNLPKRIIEKQSLAVDGYSGATFSSKAVIGAVQNALKKASTDISPLLVAPSVVAVKLPKNESVDVLVVGSGIAGMVAGITASEKGRNVLIPSLSV